MPFVIEPKPGEQILLQEQLIGSHGAAFAFGVSNQAIYLPAQRFVIKGDPYYFRRVPFSNILQIGTKRLRPAFMYVLSMLMIIVGALTTYWMLAPIFRGEGSEVRGYPIAIFVGGFVVPFIARGRKALIVAPQLAIDTATRKNIRSIQERIIQASLRAGLQVYDR